MLYWPCNLNTYSFKGLSLEIHIHIHRVFLSSFKTVGIRKSSCQGKKGVVGFTMSVTDRHKRVRTVQSHASYL